MLFPCGAQGTRNIRRTLRSVTERDGANSRFSPLVSSIVRQLERTLRENSTEPMFAAHEQLQRYAEQHRIDGDWPARVLRELARGVRVQPTNGAGPLLTPTQVDALRFAARGVGDSTAARRRGKATEAIQQDRESALGQLGAATPAHGVAIAFRMGLLS